MKTNIITTVLALIISCTMAFAQSNTKKEQQKDSVYYTCSMHPDIKIDKPGKCPKCGMILEKKTIKVPIYICSMHPDVKLNKPGKCTKCEMDLIEKK